MYLLNYKGSNNFITQYVCFVFLYVYGISLFSSLWMSFCLLISNTNINTYPRISHNCCSSKRILMVLIFNKILILAKSKKTIYTPLFYVFRGLCGQHPELFYLSLFFLSFTVYYIIKNQKLRNIWLVFSIPFVGVMFLLYWVFQFPANSYLGKNCLYGNIILYSITP